MSNRTVGDFDFQHGILHNSKGQSLLLENYNMARPGLVTPYQARYNLQTSCF